MTETVTIELTKTDFETMDTCINEMLHAALSAQHVFQTLQAEASQGSLDDNLSGLIAILELCGRGMKEANESHAEQLDLAWNRIRVERREASNADQ